MVAGREIGDGGSYLLDDTGAFMAANDWIGQVLEIAIAGMQVGVAHAAANDPYKHLGEGAARSSVSISNGADRAGTTAAVIFVWAELLAGYEAAGAATFVVQLTGVADGELDGLAGSIRMLGAVASAEAPSAGSATISPPTRPFWCFATSNNRSTSARGPACWGSIGISISRAITTSIFTI
jgi:hypothetical protein